MQKPELEGFGRIWLQCKKPERVDEKETIPYIGKMFHLRCICKELGSGVVLPELGSTCAGICGTHFGHDNERLGPA